jgi:hypothetical protein
MRRSDVRFQEVKRQHLLSVSISARDPLQTLALGSRKLDTILSSVG